MTEDLGLGTQESSGVIKKKVSGKRRGEKMNSHLKMLSPLPSSSWTWVTASTLE